MREKNAAQKDDQKPAKDRETNSWKNIKMEKEVPDLPGNSCNDSKMLRDNYMNIKKHFILSISFMVGKNRHGQL